ncbi:conserved Plasmodium protein, unknown function [Plasmodium yoelii]|uniref:Uncharacterized protein n=2 Tax=Plasmodium yoelii TaxID=5861 RepID=A0AAF0B3F3_PLAYO|nr:conserved Plasmodium protein, unknown function [Plasmodium yoelii]WBY61167.1 hypothetical protein Py17XNL_001401367 [Plasmodium yoelii yoelii]CDU20884.1 conserved Plasmodium protein, unknown function [Plasmodium yoelii]VTZ81850.1 conserved Plasmodium protein, unknown function [Plasmodium yoelii]|eukprot:XP_726010.2 conserved Plasmodium protein, unknown function [Plasmodium yoelii]
MSSNKLPICLICDQKGFRWIPLIIKQWEIKYMFCQDEEMKKTIIDTFGLYNTKINNVNNVIKYIDELKDENISLLFLALGTNKFHELVLEYVISKKKFYYIFSSDVPSLSVQTLEKFKNLLNNFNSDKDIIYDVKKEFKNINKQFYWNIFNPLMNERVFYNLKNTLNELGHIHAVQIESTFIPFLVESEDIGNPLFYRSILIISLIEFLFENPKNVLAKSYYIKTKEVAINCLSGSVAFDSLNCYFNLSVNNLSKIFSLKVYGENGFIDVSYTKEHDCFQMQRCLNHYEYPNIFSEDSHRNALSELQYFLDEQLYTNKYINSYISATHTAICFWKSNGDNITLKHKTATNDNETGIECKIESGEKCVLA